jgi:hypothetical protein
MDTISPFALPIFSMASGIRQHLKTDNGLVTAGNDDLLSVYSSLDQLRQLGFGLMNIYLKRIHINLN